LTYTCTICDKSFHHKHLLARHRRNVHKVEGNEDPIDVELKRNRPEEETEEELKRPTKKAKKTKTKTVVDELFGIRSETQIGVIRVDVEMAPVCGTEENSISALDESTDQLIVA